MRKMRFLATVSIILFVSSLYAQVELKEFIKTTDWHNTEKELVAKFSANIEQTKKYVWEDEGVESNYKFTNMSVCGYPISKSYIRVKQDNGLIFRVNLIVLDNETDISKYSDLKELLVKTLGKPHTSEEESSVWLFDDCKVQATFMDMSNVLTPEIEKYIYAINIEPVQTYFVDWTKAIVESNNAHSPIAQVEYFRTDNDNNVYIKEVGKQEAMKEKQKLMQTPKGRVVVFDGGMFCFRPTENDIVYMKSGMATTYPLVNK